MVLGSVTWRPSLPVKTWATCLNNQLVDMAEMEGTYTEGLGQEPLDLAGAGDGDLVVLGELIHTENGDNVLERLVVLQNLLHGTGNSVVLLADNVLVKDTRRRVKGVDGGVDACTPVNSEKDKRGSKRTELSNAAGQHSGGIKMGESGSWGGIRQVIGGHVDGLKRAT